MNNKQTARLAWSLSALVLLGWATASQAQTQGVNGGTGASGGAGGGAGGSGPSAMPFSGGQAPQGGLGALGQQQGGAGQAGSFSQQLAPATSSGYGTTSFLGPYYANPLSIGIPSSTANTGGAGVMGSSKPTFGQAMYNSSSSTSGAGQFGNTSGQSNFGSRQGGTFSGGAAGGNRNAAGGQSRTSTTRQGSNTIGGGRTSPGAVGGQGGFGQGGFQGGGYGAAGGSQLNSYGPQAIAYQTTFGYPVQIPQPARIRADLQEVMSRTSALPSRVGIQAMAEGEAVVLRGTVGSEQERRLAEAIARLSPGVSDLRNELEVRETAPPPKPSP